MITITMYYCISSPHNRNDGGRRHLNLRRLPAHQVLQSWVHHLPDLHSEALSYQEHHSDRDDQPHLEEGRDDGGGGGA